ncbi:hypothetical protein [Curtobacterium sp. MCPF17_021]|uniref:5-methylcytosine restriction system specificity protein McrC n=1 Tax=Curtobacterium sp. MCPF17_021 TaxID=2175639 RepID=UPI0015E8D009|nr:hypothetical protein [Curtobacterium sp. MCPF17_021]WIE82803.1 hypothetical protein DEJ29_015660 [Curtobacterium sp. MCPF17_021]
MTTRLHFDELVAQQVSNERLSYFHQAGSSLNVALRPRRPVLSVENGSVRFQNLVGSALLPTGEIVEVAPKVETTDNWPLAVVQLLEPSTRIAVTGSQRSQASTRRDDLTAALALEYARRLESALSTSGPLETYERPTTRSKRLNGHLEVTRWLRTAPLDPTTFVVTRDELTPRNDFTRGLSLVAGWLGRTASGELGSRLRRLQTAVIPASPVPTYVNPAVARQRIPSQWAKYRPAWDIAAPLLRHLSVVGDPGRAAGLEVAVEPWPLLETALERALRAMAATIDGVTVDPKTNHTLLSRNGSRSVSVIPDGAIRLHGEVRATFECKYTRPGRNPYDDHVHQALATAAALRSPSSVLVYPGDDPPVRYDVAGFLGSPVELITVGLSLFSYKRGSGDALRADRLWRLLQDRGAAPPLA